MKKQPDRSEFRWIMAAAIALMIYLLLMTITKKPQPKPVYYGPAYGPDSIPCSSEINSNCMIFERKDL